MGITKSSSRSSHRELAGAQEDYEEWRCLAGLARLRLSPESPRRAADVRASDRKLLWSHCSVPNLIFPQQIRLHCGVRQNAPLWSGIVALH
jgi:hypothetical protein